jgi:hypothetical protein
MGKSKLPKKPRTPELVLASQDNGRTYEVYAYAEGSDVPKLLANGLTEADARLFMRAKKAQR